MENAPAPPESKAERCPTELPTALPAGWLSRWPWVTFLLPMIVFLLVGSLEPTPPAQTDHEESVGQTSSDLASSDLASSDLASSDLASSGVAANAPTGEKVGEEDLGGEDLGEEGTIAYRYYPVIYSLKIALTLLAMALVWPGYRTFRWHVSPWSVVVGIAGVGLWVGLCHLQLESRLLGPLGLGGFLDQGQRSAFNPLAELSETPLWAMTFLAIRFLGLAVVVPVIEEFFLRGFFMRYVISVQWWEWPFGKVTLLAVLVGTGIPMLMHPGELLAAFVWFSLVTWLMVRTRNIWDCVVAHATTNLLLGIYVVTSGQWQLM